MQSRQLLLTKLKRNQNKLISILQQLRYSAAANPNNLEKQTNKNHHKSGPLTSANHEKKRKKGRG